MKTKIYTYQYVFLLILGCLGSLFLVGMQERALGNSAWISALVAIPIGLMINGLALALFLKNPEASLGEINVRAFGRIGGGAVTLFYAVYFFLCACTLLNYYGLFTVNLILRQSELVFFLVPVVLVMIYGVRKGITTIGRMAVIFGVLMLVLSVVVLVMEVNIADWSNLLPLQIQNTGQFVQLTVAFILVQFGELLAVISVIPEIETRKKIVKSTLVSITVGNAVVVLFVIADVAVLGASTAMQYSALYRVMRIVDFGELINKVEVFIVAGYFFATMFRVMIHFYAACKTLRDAFRMKSYKHLAVPVGTLMIGFTEWFATTSNSLIQYIIYIYPYIAVAPQIILPALALIILSVKKRKERKQVCGLYSS